MCVSQHRWAGRRAPNPPTLPLALLLPLTFLLSSTPPLAQGVIHIPSSYTLQNLLKPPVLSNITNKMKSFTAFSREDIVLVCEASGNPMPTFRWVKDGVQFGPELEGSGTLRADKDTPLEMYQGYYRCFASNTLGTAMTHTIRVIVESQPMSPKQRRVQQEAYEGDSIILSCQPPKSSTPPIIHWMDMYMVHISQSERVTIGLDGNLYFANLLKNDSRDDYICHAQYRAAWTVLPNTAVSLNILPRNDVVTGMKPELLQPHGTHSAIMALRGHTLVLECIPEGLPTPQVRWSKKDSSLQETSGRLHRHGRWLRFNDITQRDDGEYECLASNSYGMAKHSFTVTVEAAPYWVKEPENNIYSPGETLRLDCQAEGIPTPTITWSINGQPITDVDEEPRRSIFGGVLILDNVQFEDTAIYQCEASNQHGSILLNTNVYIIKLPPQILTSDGIVYRSTEGKNVSLHCETFGSPRPHITWEGQDGVPLLSDPRISLLTNGTLEVSNVSVEDSGIYICLVSNSNISIEAHMDIFNQTVILIGPQDLQVQQGDNALLDCHFSKDSRQHKLTVVWTKDGQALERPVNGRITVFRNGTLKVAGVHSGDSGTYSCQVRTPLDHVVASGSITIVAPPDPPEHLRVELKDHHSTLSWIPGHSHNSPITEFIVESREEQHTSKSHWKWEEMKRVTGNFNSLQLNLHPYCTYSFRVTAINKIGPSVPSKPSDPYSTPAAVPRENPTGVRSDSTDPGTMIITWDEMHKRSQSGEGFKYKVSWRESGGNGHWRHDYVASPPFLVNNTGTYATFDIKVQAVNSLGGGPAPEPKTGHSGEDIPEEAPGGVIVTVVNTTARVKWNEAQRVRGLLRGYKIYYRRLGTPGSRHRRSLRKLTPEEEEPEAQREPPKEREHKSRVLVVHGAKTSGEVKELRPYSKYELSVTAFNSKGESPPSIPVHFNTPEGVPGPPASLSFDSPSNKSLIIYWTPPLETNGILQGYTLQYQKDLKNQISDMSMQLVSDPNVTHMVLDSLDPSCYYNFSVIAHTAAGDGPPIVKTAATLLDGAPPSDITIIPGNTLLNLSWVPRERVRNHGFQIRYVRKTEGGQWEETEVLNSTQGFYSLTGLDPGTEYHLTILNGNDTHWFGVKMTRGPVPVVTSTFATQGWLIGLISAIVLLVLILLILCLIKRRKGGKYAVKDKEDKEVDSEARPMKDETFGEYSDGDEKRTDSQPSLSGDSKLGSDDSLAEYGDSVDIQFNEDGSFIGQYSGRGPVPHGNESSGPASPVNAVPPPPIAPSMSSILNRPS